jgi:hypothetical protein
MATLATVVIALGGVGVVVYGWMRYLRSRFHVRDRARARRGAKIGVALVILGGLLALTPDVLANLAFPATAAGEAMHGAAQAIGTLAMVLYRMVVLSLMVILGFGMFLTSEYVTSRVRRLRERAEDFTAGLRGRRTPGGAILPRDWDGMVAYDTQLSRRFLDYENVDASVNFPVMRDYRDPLTSAALTAMLRCDELRTRTQPAGFRRASETPYGRAVAEFAVALAAAEENARRLVRSNVTTQERAALDHAAKALAFMHQNTTTPQERDAAYQRVVAELSSITAQRPTDPVTADPSRPHPWLDVHRRAGAGS